MQGNKKIINRNTYPLTNGIKQIIKALNSLVGDPSNTELEHRMFNVIMLLMAITGLITIIQNFLTGNPGIMQLISGIALFGGLGICNSPSELSLSFR